MCNLELIPFIFGELIGYGITMAVDTREMAMMMVLSVIPLIIMQIPDLFHFSSAARNVTLMVALIIAVAFLISYFIYQVLHSSNTSYLFSLTELILKLYCAK